MYPGLAILPTELVSHISMFLEAEDFGSLRLTCKVLYQQTL